MRNRHQPMRLSRDEELYLRHWIWDEARYEQGPGEAKRLRVALHVRPADLAVLIAAAMPDPAEQLAASSAPPAEPVRWPWSEESLRARIAEARCWLEVSATPAATPRGK